MPTGGSSTDASSTDGAVDVPRVGRDRLEAGEFVHSVSPTVETAYEIGTKRPQGRLKGSLIHMFFHNICAQVGTNWGWCDGCSGRGAQMGRGCDLMRLVRSVTWLNRLRRSAINWRIFRSACITVV